jgi:hypothetical protein
MDEYGDGDAIASAQYHADVHQNADGDADPDGDASGALAAARHTGSHLDRCGYVDVAAADAYAAD